MTTFAGHKATTKIAGTAELRKLTVHRHAGIFRVLESDERDRLRTSMRTGYDEAQPIVVWKRTGEIVDGRNRRDLAVELACTNVPVAWVEFPDEQAVTSYVVAANLARRHLTTSERGELAARLVANGASTRSAAKQTGVSKDTAHRAVAAARTSGVSSETPAKARTVGTDGKSYPATKAKSKRAAPRRTPHSGAYARVRAALEPLTGSTWSENSLRGMTPAEARALVKLVQKADAKLVDLEQALKAKAVVSRALR